MFKWTTILLSFKYHTSIISFLGHYYNLCLQLLYEIIHANFENAFKKFWNGFSETEKKNCHNEIDFILTINWWNLTRDFHSSRWKYAQARIKSCIGLDNLILHKPDSPKVHIMLVCHFFIIFLFFKLFQIWASTGMGFDTCGLGFSWCNFLKESFQMKNYIFEY